MFHKNLANFKKRDSTADKEKGEKSEKNIEVKPS